MGRKQNIWENIATKVYVGGYKHTNNSSCTEDSANSDNYVSLTLGRTSQLTPPPSYKGGWMEPLPGVFVILRRSEIILN